MQAIVQLFELDERTVARWRDRAGRRCQQVHHVLLEQGELDLMHVQADYIVERSDGKIADYTDM